MWLKQTTKLLLAVSADQPVSSELPSWWQARYHQRPAGVRHRLIKRGYLTIDQHQILRVTAKGQAVLASVPDITWAHRYYFPGIIDLMRFRRAYQPGQPYETVMQLLAHGLAENQSDLTISMLLYRLQLRVNLETAHFAAAATTLMRLFYFALGGDTDELATSFTYRHSQYKLTRFDRQSLQHVLEGLDWRLSDFEWAFSAWLTDKANFRAPFTRFEMMRIVMYELSENQAALTALYAEAGQRYHAQLRQQALTKSITI
ncbi:hypothetical protein [Lacticaseibacillus brantae]|uniref:Uncharacterized protein n=1 Tax=Lacticaseibacillus brantae DSM 23927 TaxID=1423727 RepID=A0A0R2AX45_9LACO|nr:hypothetical protein [Lacticaseibacillus brantae]KRM71584.1 hypothetical protein FC34_GL001700 [Lacticaseibacillus brantae DSM 23927]